MNSPLMYSCGKVGQLLKAFMPAPLSLPPAPHERTLAHGLVAQHVKRAEVHVALLQDGRNLLGEAALGLRRRTCRGRGDVHAAPRPRAFHEQNDGRRLHQLGHARMHLLAGTSVTAVRCRAAAPRAPGAAAWRQSSSWPLAPASPASCSALARSRRSPGPPPHRPAAEHVSNFG